MSGYDLSSQVPFSLMKGRLGVYDKRPFDPSKNSVEGVEHQSTRLRQAGGNRQQERMIKDKRRSLDHAVWNSYQAAEVVKIDATDRKPVRALINPNKLKQDYDDKVISVGYENNFEVGTVFECLGTKTYWLIYLQDLTELAYFRGDIRKCSYQIAWEDEDGLHTTYAAIRGPVETKIDSIQKHGVSLDVPNFSLSILMPNNEYTLNYFNRYTKFYLQGNDTCWRVEATDSISTPGILEVIAIEYYANETEDDIENGIVGGLVEEIKDPNSEEINEEIVGETFIKPKRSYSYTFSGRAAAVWSVDTKYPVELKIDSNDPRKVTLIWTGGYSGQFVLNYGDLSKTIVVESLF